MMETTYLKQPRISGRNCARLQDRRAVARRKKKSCFYRLFQLFPIFNVLGQEMQMRPVLAGIFCGGHGETAADWDNGHLVRCRCIIKGPLLESLGFPRKFLRKAPLPCSCFHLSATSSSSPPVSGAISRRPSAKDTRSGLSVLNPTTRHPGATATAPENA